MPIPFQPERLSGVHAATVCPFTAQGAIDEVGLAHHIAAVASRPGINGLLLNGHAGEGPFLTTSEKSAVIRVAQQAAPGTFICAGVTSEATAAAVLEAEAAQKAGADALLVFPPAHFALGHDTEMAVAHHRAIAAVGAPLLLYRAPIRAGHLAYGVETLSALAAIDAVVGVKEGSWEVAAYEEVRRTLKAIRPELAVLASGDEHLMTGFLIGSEGSQVSLAAVIPDTIVALFEAAQSGDWVRARWLHDVLYPLSAAIYRAAPAYRATARLKTALLMMDAIASDSVRLPMQSTPAHERTALSAALNHAGVTTIGAPLPA
ncbi:MAG: dihydrodipicolinate synthase family protein [Pseudomonadota bacterium]